MAEPVSLAEALLNTRVDSSEEDSLVEGFMLTGRRWVEKHTGHILVQREVTETFDNFGPIQLKAWPIARDTPVTIEYLDTAGVPQPLANSFIAAHVRPARLYPALASRWPCVPSRPGAVTVTFEAGYATPDDVPAEMKSAILIIVKGLYDERVLTPAVEAAAKALCREYRLRRV